jgi:hypothetical protein
MRSMLFALVLSFLWVVPGFTQVDTAWVRRYNGPADSTDWAYAIALDRFGNAYVTGTSWGSGTYADYATIKYYLNGDTAWVRRYNGPGNSHDEAQGIAVDGSGYVYVTGSSGGSGEAGYDFATIKYYPNGDTAWVRRYDGPANGDDWPLAIAVDDSSNVYVTGCSYGGSQTDYDYATIKYKPNGDTAWVRRYNSSGDGYDEARAIAVDSSGNVYVTGSSGTIKYDAGGNQLWITHWGGVDIVLDAFDNIYLTGTYDTASYSNYITVKFYPNGDTAWVRRYNGPGNGLDEAHAIAIDGANNVYVTGVSVGVGQDEDWATIKYYPNGDTAWVRRYNGPGGYSDQAYAIAVDELSNVYVTGYSGVGASYDYTTIKYYLGGDIAWLKTYDGPGNGTDIAQAIALDGHGNVYLTGGSRGSRPDYDYATIKYRQYYLTDGITVMGFSPIDLIVTDPQGDSIGIGFNTIPGAQYDTTQDYNGDGDKDDIVTIPNRLVGDYLIQVVAELGGGGGIYSMGIRIDGSNVVYMAWHQPCPPVGEIDTFTYHAPLYLAGDATGDWNVDISDVVYLLNYLFVHGPAPDPFGAGDATCDGVVDVSDVVYLLNYLFARGPSPSC